MDVLDEIAVSVSTPDEDTNISLPKACPICTTPFDKIVPKLLPCLHSFCQPCLESKLREVQSRDDVPPPGPTASTSSSNATSSSSRLKCPKCGQEFLVSSNGIASLIDNQFILEVVSKSSASNDTEGHVCTSCEDNSSATSYCLNCTEWLCDACVLAHQRVRVTKDHEIKSKEALKESLRGQGRSERALYCQRHPCEKLSLFCANCERLTCRDCQLHEHKEHKYQFVNEAAGRYREYFRKRLTVLGEKVGPLAESIEAVENSTKHLDHKAEMVASEIKNSSAEMVKAVKQRETVLLSELNALVHFKRKMLTKQSKDLHLMEEILKHNFEFAKNAVMQGSDVSLLYSKRQLGSRIQNLLSLKYRVTPVAHSDLKFVTEAVKLCNSISKAGSVMTPSSQLGHRTSTSVGNIRARNSPYQQQNGSHAKGNPLNSLDPYGNRKVGGVFSPRGPSSNTHKPSSKVYPNVVTSHVPGMSSDMSTVSNLSFMNSSFSHILPKLLNSGVASLPPGLMSAGYRPSPSSFPGGVSTQVRKTTPDGAVIPLHHMVENGRQVRQSSPSYDKAATLGLRKSSSSSPGIMESSSLQVSSGLTNLLQSASRGSSSSSTADLHPAAMSRDQTSTNHLSVGSTPRDGGSTVTSVSCNALIQPATVASTDSSSLLSSIAGGQTMVKDSLNITTATATHNDQLPTMLRDVPFGTTHGTDHPPVSSPKLNLPSPKPSASPHSSSSIPKQSPNPSQTSLSSPQVSPHPQVVAMSPISMSPSPSPSPLPTFLDPEMQNVLSGGIKIKVEKDASPPPPSMAFASVKMEPATFNPCGFSSSSFHASTSFGPPSNNSSNEDWCAVCHNGGELLCCDTCPKVFHLLCHVPSLAAMPSEAYSWSCGLCESQDAAKSKQSEVLSGHKRRAPVSGMSERDIKLCEKMLLELFCHPDSVPFHEKVSKAVPNYYKIIHRPMDLTSMKAKLQPVHFEHYTNFEQFLDDCKQIFKNCALFNEIDSEVGKMGRRLAADFQGIVSKYLPHYKHQNDDEPQVKKRCEDL